MPGSKDGILRKLRIAPSSWSFTNSGIAFDTPPAPTSCTDTIGLWSSMRQQVSITSWQRRSISGFSRCTDAKSKLSPMVPLSTEEAAPPPRPINIAGPPNTMSKSPGKIGSFST